MYVRMRGRSGNAADGPLSMDQGKGWYPVTIRRMLILSFAFHGLLFLTLFLSSFIWPQRRFIPLIQQVELVSLPQERVEQPKHLPEQGPKTVEQRPKVERHEPLRIKKEARMAKPVEKKRPVKKETLVTEKPRILKEPQKEKVEETKEAVNKIPGIPEIMPVLQKPYTEFEYYHALIGREIRKRWSPPPTSIEGQRMEAIVAFSISRSGRIDSAVRLEKSSGNLFYDQAALRATLGPLPPPPPGYTEELLKMRLIYVLDQSYLN